MKKQGYERNLDPDGVDALENSVRGWHRPNEPCTKHGV